MIIQAKVINLIVSLLDWLVVVLFLIREGLRPSPANTIQYQGSEPLLPEMETLKVQPALMQAVGDRRAIFLQWLHGWLLYNIREGKNPHNGATWSYNSYPDLVGYFPMWSEGWFKSNLPWLENEGWLFSTQDAPFCKKGQKAYRINYEKILSLMGSQDLVDTLPETSRPPASKYPAGYEKLADNNSSKTRKKNQSVSQIRTSTTTQRAREIAPLVINHGDGVVDKPDYDSGEIDDFNYGEPVRDATAPIEPILDTDIAPPDSAPSPPPERKIVSDEHDELVRQIKNDLSVLGHEITETAIRVQIKIHGAARCEAVANWYHRHGEDSGIKKPPGWWVIELREDHLSIGDFCERNVNPYKTGPWADIIKS